MNDATREAGGTLGVAVIGSVFLSLYARRIDSSLFAHLPGATHTTARTSVAAAAQTVARAPAPLQHPLLTGFNSSFMSGLHTASAVAAGVCILGASVHSPFRAGEGRPSAPLPPGWQGRPAPTWTSFPVRNPPDLRRLNREPLIVTITAYGRLGWLVGARPRPVPYGRR